MTPKIATFQDLPLIAQCHIAAFPNSVTSLFGVPFVAHMFEWYLSAPNKFLFWIEEDGKCIGYCGGFAMDGSDAYGSASGMTQFGFGAAVKIMIRKPWLFFHPEIRARYPFIITNVKRRLKKIIGIHEKPASPPPISNPSTPSGITAGLVVIGVLPSLHKKGIGSILQQEFERIAQSKGATNMQLSVRIENSQAISSYQRNGWTIVEDQRIAYLMTKEVSGS
jgi:ribosomal protein S18 acetylase RimI-like enzyme